MSTLAQRLAAIGVLLLAMAIVAVLSLRALGVPVAVGPLASATPPIDTPTPVPGSPGPSLDPLDAFAEIEAQVLDLRRLPAADIGPPEILTRAELADELRRIFDETWTPEELERDNLTLRALGLLAADQDLRALTEELYAGQALGFYEFERERMVVVSDAGLTPEARVTYAHEYTHALQDAAFDTGAARDAQVSDEDAALARVALEEGDASLAMVLWALEHLTPEEQLGISQTPLPDMTGIPDWMVAQLEFPYLAGAEFVTQLWASGGWDAVDAAYADLPDSTEQVIHSDKYLNAEAPVEVTIPALATGLASELGGAWEGVEETTIGEAMVAIWLEELGVSNRSATEAAAGWGGDSLVVASDAEAGWALAWRIAWDNPTHATEFERAHARITDDLAFETRFVRLSETETLIVHASSAEIVDPAVGLAGG
ncbi:MAG TPA: hypothetical protein VEW45_01715 [Candidatus Dormibacteraeota bacterium]|nr:hypothetical protein [Candidatus Dormibacteraeota bacterium]